MTLGTHPESFQLEQNGDRVYVNVSKQPGIIVGDRKRRVAVAKWGVGSLFATGSDRLFVAVHHHGLQSARVLVYKVKGANDRLLIHTSRDSPRIEG
jgi:hypothetical protein